MNIIEGIYVSSFWKDGVFVTGKGLSYKETVADIQNEIDTNNNKMAGIEKTIEALTTSNF